jgi:hypothetical protein
MSDKKDFKKFLKQLKKVSKETFGDEYCK